MHAAGRAGRRGGLPAHSAAFGAGTKTAYPAGLAGIGQAPSQDAVQVAPSENASPIGTGGGDAGHADDEAGGAVASPRTAMPAPALAQVAKTALALGAAPAFSTTNVFAPLLMM